MEYIQIQEDGELPDISKWSPFKVVVAIENPLPQIRRKQVCNWMVAMGGRYAMLCGEGVANWSQDIRAANIEQFDLESMTPEQFVMITEHENERLRAVFWHAKKYAKHSHLDLERLIVLHISSTNRSLEYQSIFNKTY